MIQGIALEELISCELHLKIGTVMFNLL